jgi:hypothetical protein
LVRRDRPRPTALLPPRSYSQPEAAAATTMNKKPTGCTIVLKPSKLYCILIPLYMFRALLRPSSGTF